jgi:hypothetical protein
MKLGMRCKGNYAAYVKEKMSKWLRKDIDQKVLSFINHAE